MSRREGPGDAQWLCGLHSVEETLRGKPRSAKELLVAEGAKGVEEIVRLARQAGVRVRFVDRRQLDRAAGDGRHQGVALRAALHEGESLQGLLERFPEGSRQGLVLVALDEVQDPHNLGAIARSALNLGARALILPERRSAPVTGAVVSASAGAIQKLPVVTVVNLGQALERLKEAGFWVYGADASGRPAWDAVFNTPLVLVIGSEGYGMRPLVAGLCDEVVSVPQAASGVESLNASCAASVLLYEIARQVRKPS
ncbi:MAG: 23S rRNA (guanosine(2251)-2'-O)-methyltransferase RlmB [Elusimicrobia bacterium]|jgi:23S rRNA (guanosine2251-2'-O)-methyltransferase|nr:23S rRNA (guanosine(2251)-2'-O)-methyltransferase RlmB [Elusimicrobiota bacterium]